MKYKGALSLALALVALAVLFMVQACTSPPEFPFQPRIEFDEVIFKAGVDDNDSLIIKIKFEDGDGDLGLSPTEDAAPYNRLIYYNNKTGQPFVSGSIAIEDLLKYADRNEIDSLPPFASPFNCTNWIINPSFSNGVVQDTLYYQTNPRHYNLFIDFYVLENGVFRLFNWQQEFPYPNCGSPFYARFPRLEDSSTGPMQGTLRYGMTSPGFEFLFSLRTLKLKVRIMDRAGNWSNEVEYGPFTLNDVRQ
jgi:hypothetical protein